MKRRYESNIPRERKTRQMPPPSPLAPPTTKVMFPPTIITSPYSRHIHGDTQHRFLRQSRRRRSRIQRYFTAGIITKWIALWMPLTSSPTAALVSWNQCGSIMIPVSNRSQCRSCFRIKYASRRQTEMQDDTMCTKRQSSKLDSANIVASRSDQSTKSGIQAPIPPWLSRHSSSESYTNNNQRNEELAKVEARYNLDQLRTTLLQCSTNNNDGGDDNDRNKSNNIHLQIQDVDDIINAVLVASNHEPRLISGASDFLSLLLNVQLEEHRYFRSTTTSIGSTYDNYDDDDDDDENIENGSKERVDMVTRDTLIASAFHYCDCVVAREGGIYDLARQVVRGDTGRVQMPSFESGKEEEKDDLVNNGTFAKKRSRMLMLNPPGSRWNNDDNKKDIDDSSGNREKRTNGIVEGLHPPRNLIYSSSHFGKLKGSNNDNRGIEQYGDEAVQIAQTAARIKRAEIMADAVLSPPPSSSNHNQQQKLDYDKSFQTNAAPPTRISPTTTQDAAALTGLLLSTADDWRALAIRSVACLYRLRGIVRYEQERELEVSAMAVTPSLRRMLPSWDMEGKTQTSWSGYSSAGGDDGIVDSYNLVAWDAEKVRSMQVVRVAREALYVYAPLAQRLGMQRLKGEMENLAFRVLYKRQYVAAKSLYEKSGAGMRSVASFVSDKVEETLMEDELLSSQLERLTVTSRVKEPYSLWRKLLKKRIKLLTKKALRNENHRGGNGDETTASITNPRSSAISSTSSTFFQQSRDELTVTDVQDAIALRVILSAKKLKPTESDESLQSREEFLCYYVQKLLTDKWPVTDGSRVKDYISMPKLNGYRSLHHTATIFRYGQEWPFEIQVRSEEMHRIAEYGVAAHWDYKVQGLQQTSSSSSISAKATTRDMKHLLPSTVKSSSGESSTVHTRKLKVVEEELLDPIPSSSSSPSIFDHDSYTTVSQQTKNESIRSSSFASMSRENVVESYIDALAKARQDLLQKNVYVFFSPTSSALDGKIVDISAGSSVADALEEVERRSDLHLKGCRLSQDYDVDASYCYRDNFKVYLNGRTAELTDLLSNGDVLTLPPLVDRNARIEPKQGLD